METRGTALWCAAIGRCWVLRWEEAGKVRTASPKLVVEGIGCCCVTWWRPALMETEGEEDAAEGKPSVLMGLLGEGEEDGATVLLLLGLSRYGFKGRGECAAVWGRKFPTGGAAVWVWRLVWKNQRQRVGAAVFGFFLGFFLWFRVFFFVFF
jgi:hypothetical protein